MSDVPEIPTIEGNSFESETGNLDIINDTSAGELSGGSEKIESNKEELGNENPVEEGLSNEEVIEVGEKRIEDINEDVKNVTNSQEPTNSYLIEQLKEPEAKDPEVGREQLLEIDRINRQIEETGKEAVKNIAEISGLHKQNSELENTFSEEKQENNLEYSEIRENDENLENRNKDGAAEGEGVEENGENEVIEDSKPEENKQEKTESPEEYNERIKKEITEEIRQILDEELSENTNEILEKIGLTEMNKGITAEQFNKFMTGLGQRLDKMNPIDKSSVLGSLAMLDKLPAEEKDRFKEMLKFLFKMAAKTAGAIISKIARQIAKSADKDDKATQIIFGSIADLTDFGTEAVAGKESIHNDVVGVIKIMRGK